MKISKNKNVKLEEFEVNIEANFTNSWISFKYITNSQKYINNKTRNAKKRDISSKGTVPCHKNKKIFVSQNINDIPDQLIEDYLGGRIFFWDLITTIKTYGSPIEFDVLAILMNYIPGRKYKKRSIKYFLNKIIKYSDFIIESKVKNGTFELNPELI